MRFPRASPRAASPRVEPRFPAPPSVAAGESRAPMAMDRPVAPVVPEAELLIAVMDGHDRTRRILERRLTTTRVAASQWQDGDTTALLETLERSSDDALICDFLRWLRADRRPSVMTLDFCSRILPLVLACIRSKSVEIARGGCKEANE